MNLSAPQTFRSKEISKSNVVDDMVASNGILYEPGEHPDHVVVIKVWANETLAKLVTYIYETTITEPHLLWDDRVVCPVFGRQQEGHGWVHFGDIHGREEHHSVAQHLWGLSSCCSNHLGFSSPCWAQLSHSAQSRRRGLFPYTLSLPSLVSPSLTWLHLVWNRASSTLSTPSPPSSATSQKPLL